MVTHTRRRFASLAVIVLMLILLQFSRQLFSNYDFDFPTFSFDDNLNHTRIIIGYRHFFEWLPSVYFQQNYRAANEEWFKSRPSLISYIQHHIDEWESTMQKTKNNVQIFDIHQPGDDLTQQFICEMMKPMSDSICQDLRRQQQASNETNKNGTSISETKQRQSYSLDAERIVEVAFMKGYFPKRPDKATTIRTISKKLDGSNFTTHHYYRVCLSTLDQQRLYNMSWSLYLDIRNDPAFQTADRSDGSSTTKDAFDELFQKASAKQKFCEIDTEKVLSNDGFSSFLRTLNK